MNIKKRNKQKAIRKRLAIRAATKITGQRGCGGCRRQRKTGQ